jgi:ABC-type lipoprotein release transport system permease subunit
MRLLFFYSLRNLLTRRLTTFLTAGGMALVIFVFASIQMLAEGLEKTLVETGSDDNVVVIRRSSQNEVQSVVDRDQAALVEIVPEAAAGPDGTPLLAKEVVVLMVFEKRGSGAKANVTIRGIAPNSLRLRPQVELIAGRLPRPGSSEVAVGKGIAQGFRNAGFGERISFAMREWSVVGVFDAGKTGYGYEIWGDAEQLMQAFRRPAYSSILFRLKDSDSFEKVKERIQGDPRLTLEAKRETTYYKDQSEMMAKFLRILGLSLTIIFSTGAVVGGMITMYAAVAHRTREIGTLRALGFQRSAILYAFLSESILIGLIGGLAGLFFSTFLQFFTVSTVNFQTFSELAFSFSLTVEIAAQSLLFALVMGLVGGILPAIRASGMRVVDALRAT